MRYGSLSDHFIRIAAKRLAPVEADTERPNQHEFNIDDREDDGPEQGLEFAIERAIDKDGLPVCADGHTATPWRFRMTALTAARPSFAVKLSGLLRRAFEARTWARNLSDELSRFARPVSPRPGFGMDSFWVVAGLRFATSFVTKRPVLESR